MFTSAGADPQSALQHGPDRRGVRGGAGAVAAYERLALEGQPVLYGHGSTEGGDAVEAFRGDGLRVVEEPAVPGREEPFGGQFLEYREISPDGFVVGGVQPESQPFSMSRRTAFSNSTAYPGSSSGRGWAKFSKSAAAQVRFSPAPLRRSHSSPSSGRAVPTQRVRSSISWPAVCGKRW